MPDFSDDSFSDDDLSYSDFNAASAGDMQAAAAHTGVGPNRGALTTIAGDAAFGVLDLVDTVASSIPGVSHVLGAKRGSVNDAALRLMNRPGLTDFYTQNRAGIEVASGIEGIIATEFLGAKAAKVLAPLARSLSSVPFAGRMITLDRQYAEAMGTVRAVDSQLAARGTIGSKAWSDAVTITPMGPSLTGAPAAAFTTTRASAAATARGLAFGKGVVHAAASEARMGVFLNQNSMLYSEDYGQNAMWMGLGVGLGGAFSVLGTGYQMRKFVNSDNMRRIKAGATDPLGMEAARLEVPDLGGGKQVSWLGHLNGWVSDRVTNYMVGAKAEMPAGADSKSFKNLVTEQLNQAVNTELPKITNKGLPGIQGTAFAHKGAGYWNHITEGLNKDAGLLYGAEMVGAIADDATTMGTHLTLQAQAESRLKAINRALGEGGLPTRTPEDTARLTQLKKTAEAFKVDGARRAPIKMSDTNSGGFTWNDTVYRNTLQEIEAIEAGSVPQLTKNQRMAALVEQKQLKFQQGLTPMVLLDGELMPLSHGAAYDNWIEPKVTNQILGKNDNLFEAVERDSGKTHNVGIQTDGDVFLPKGKTIDTADHMDVLRLYRAADQLTTDLARKVGDANFSWDVPMRLKNGQREYNWLSLDIAEELMKRTGDRAQINWGGLTRETAQKESLIQKIKALKAAGYENLDETARGKLRLRYNLPRASAYEAGVTGIASPIDRMITGFTNLTDAELGKLTIQDIRKAYAGFASVGDFQKISPDQVKTLMGNSLNFMKDSEGIATKPVLVYKRNIAPMDWAPDRLAERIASKKLATATMLTDRRSGPITRELFSGILANPDYRLGAEVGGLMDTQVAGNIPGLTTGPTQTAKGAFVNSFIQAEWRARDNPVILAITRLRETVDRQMRGIMRDSIEKNFGDTLSTLNGPRNGASKLMLDDFHSFRGGWDLEEKVATTQGPGGKNLHAFVLADTVGNQTRYQQQFGRKMTPGSTLLDSRGREIVVDDMALDIQQRYNRITEAQRVEKNSLLASQGLPQIHKQAWYVQAPSVEGKFIGFAKDSRGQTIPGASIVAKTQAEFDKKLSQMRADPKSALNTVPGADFYDRDSIMRYGSIWDKAQMEMLDSGTTAVQGDKTSQGFLTQSRIESGRFDESLRGLRDVWLNHGNDVMHIAIDDQVKAAQARSAIASGVTANADSKSSKYRSVYDYWLEAAQGRSGLASEGSLVGKFYNPAENWLNRVIGEHAPTANRVWQGVADRLRTVNPFDKTATNQKEFVELSNALGKHMPFESAADMIERRAMGVKPTELADITGGANRFTATWMLRMLEPAAAVMNMAGIVNAMPAVLRHVSAKPGETAADVAARIGHSASIFTQPNGAVISVPDMAKIAARGFKRAWNKTSDAEYQYMAKNGFLSQEVAEFQRQFNAVESKSTWSKWMTGDPQGKTDWAKKGLVGWLSILTDKSEDFSRSWGHMVGLEVAEMSGITNSVAKHNFAHDIANKMIANYSPTNRPEVFQGAIGAPLGLFQSFMLAYYQRMFRYIETGDVRTIATQYAMQGTLFGAKSVPGWNELNNLFFEHAEGDDSPYDALQRKFGPDAGDLLTMGTLSNLPKLFGVEGVDLVSRGDVSPRVVTQNPLTNSPAISAIGKIKDGMMQGLHAFFGDNPDLSSQQIGEILSNMIPNRPLAGMAEMTLAGGYDTDSLGQVAWHTQTTMGAVYRMLGVRSLEHSKELEAFYGNKQAQEIEGAKREVFNTDIRGAIRSGNPDSVPKFIEKYLEDGGDPRQVKRMIGSAYEAATQTRAERQLDSVIRNPNKMDQVQRLLDAHVGIGDDEEDVGAVWGTNDPLDNEVPLNSEDSDMSAYQLDQ